MAYDPSTGFYIPGDDTPAATNGYRGGLNPLSAANYVLQSSNATPSAAESAAQTAAAKATAPVDTSSDVGSQGRAPMFNSPSDPSVQAWNAHVAAVAAQLSNLGVPNAAGVLGQTPPTADKAAGEAAIRAGGAPRLLNYGYGSTIVGSGSGVGGKFNSFTGVGSGATPAGAAGVLGTPATSPFEQAQQHLLDTLNQAQTLRGRGDLASQLQARGLENQAARLGSLFNAISQHAFTQGQLGIERQRQNLAEQQARPGLLRQNQILALQQAGKLEEARRLQRMSAGESAEPAPISAQPMTTLIPGDTPFDRSRYGVIPFPTTVSR